MCNVQLCVYIINKMNIIIVLLSELWYSSIQPEERCWSTLC